MDRREGVANGCSSRSCQRPATIHSWSSMVENRNQRKSADGIDRRGMLACMAWVGTGLVWTLRGGILSSRAFGQEPRPAEAADFSFVQISDSHIGFMKEPNKNVVGTLQLAIARINRLPRPP